MSFASRFSHVLASTAEGATTGVTSLLPTREALLDRIAQQLASAGAPATLVIVGLLRRDDGWPTPPETLNAVTSLLAGSLRGDDWLGSPGAGEFAIVLSGPETAAETAATRLTTAVASLGIPGLTAAAGIAPLTAGEAATEVFRRATLSLTAARRVGGGTVLRYREPA